jgi:hypothetical protein
VILAIFTVESERDAGSLPHRFIDRLKPPLELLKFKSVRST